MRVIPVISVKQQGRLYRRGVPRAMSAGRESYLGSAVWLMVCERAKFHPHETAMLSDASWVRGMCDTSWVRGMSSLMCHVT